jgi:hypothetical protein
MITSKRIYNFLFCNYICLFIFFIPLVAAHGEVGEKKQEIKEEFISPRDGLEYYQVVLFNYLYSIIDKEALKKRRIEDFINRKAQTLNFFEAIGLFLFSLTKKKYDKYVLWSLERLYVLSADAKLSELILWNIAAEYEKCEKFRVASELYSQFKKLFPGSTFYWAARYKEIVTAYKFCQHEYHDIYDTEKTLNLAQEYTSDLLELEKTVSVEIITIWQDLSMRMIKKTVNIALHYLKKNQYTYNPICLLSAWQRLDELNSDIDYFSNFIDQYTSGDNVHQKYCAVLIEMKSIMSLFFEKNNTVVLPSGNNYEEEYDIILQHIVKNKSDLICQLSDVYKKINYCIESYYDII